MKLTKLALACALTTALAACGGGGGDAVVSDTGAPTTRTLAGVAAKGLIKNGIVKVYLYNADGTKSAIQIAPTRTLADGSYSISLGSNIGLFKIEVSADASTTMADEVSRQDIAMPVGMTLRSVFKLDSAASTTIKGYVTPLTEMLVKAAESAGGLTSDNFESARAGVTKMMGFDPLETKPINVENPTAAAAMDASEQKQSLYLAALSKLANDPTNNLGCVGSSVIEKIDCIVKNTSGSAVLKDGILSLSTAAGQELRTARNAVINDSNVNKTAITSADGQSDFSPVTVPTSTAVLEPIPASKAMFASLRTNLNAFSNAQKTGALDVRSDALKADFDTAIAPLDKDLADWILLSGRGITLFNEFKNANVGPYVPNSAPTYSPVFQSNIGNCQVYADTTADTPAKISSDAKSVFCRLNATMVAGTYERNAGGSTWKQFTKTILLTPVAGTTSSFSYESRARMETVQSGDVVTVSKATIGVYGPGSTARAKGTVSYTMSGNIETGATINGFMPARTDDMGVAITDQEEWNVSYVRTPEAGGVNKYALSGDITALKDGVSVSSVVLENGSYIRTVSPVGNYEINNEVNLVLSVAAGKSKVTGTLSLSKFSADKNGNNYMPTDLKFTGSFSNASSEFFNGTLTAKTSNYAAYDNSLPRSTANFAPTSGSFVGIFRIPDRPDLKLTLSASNPVFNSTNFSGQYDDGTNTILISSTNATPKVINISNANGVSMQLNEGIDSADVMKNSSKIAILNRNTGIINYTDGSFESLK